MLGKLLELAGITGLVLCAYMLGKQNFADEDSADAENPDAQAKQENETPERTNVDEKDITEETDVSDMENSSNDENEGLFLNEISRVLGISAPSVKKIVTQSKIQPIGQKRAKNNMLYDVYCLDEVKSAYEERQARLAAKTHQSFNETDEKDI